MNPVEYQEKLKKDFRQRIEEFDRRCQEYLDNLYETIYGPEEEEEEEEEDG